MMTNTDNKLELTNDRVWPRHLQRIWNMRITYPTTEFLFFDDTVKSVFRHCKYYNDVVSTLAYIVFNELSLP